MRKQRKRESERVESPRAEARKKNRKRRALRKLVLGLLVMALIIAGGVAVWKSGDPGLTELLRTHQYEKRISGSGVLVFSEYAPGFLSGVKVEDDNVEAGKRLRVGDELFSLDSADKNLVQAEIERWKREEKSGGHRIEARERIDFLERVLKTGRVTAPFSSTVEVTLDGYESLFNPRDLDTWAPGDVPERENATERRPGLKFVDNRLFYLAVDLKPTHLDQGWKLDPESDNMYSLLVNDTPVNGRLLRIAKDGSGRTLLIFALRDKFDELRNLRFASVDIIQASEQAFKIPIDSVFQDGDQMFCYVLNADQTAAKTQVHILDINARENVFIVKAVNPAAKEKTPLRQLKVFDRVIRNPEGITDGKLIMKGAGD